MAKVARGKQRSGSCGSGGSNGGAVLITKHDFDQLRINALSPAREYPQVLPACAPAPRGAGGGAAAAARNPGIITGASKSDGPKGSWPPALQRRTRSASSKRPSALSPMPPEVEAPASQHVNAFKPGPPPRVVRVQHMMGGAPGDRSGSSPKVSIGSAACGSQGGCAKAGLQLEMCGYDPRRAPRPAELPQDLVYMRAGQVVAPEQPPRDAGFAAPLLLVSGQAKTVCSHPAVSSDSPPPDGGAGDLRVEDWTSSEDEGHDALSGSECEAFHYRKYRYQESSQARGKAGPPEPLRRRARRTAGAAAAEPDAGGYSTPWVADSENPPPPLRVDSYGVSSRCSTPQCEEERPNDEELRRMADAVARFYRLPGEVGHAVRFKQNLCNAVVVDESAWARRERDSNFEEPLTLWIRGGRIYDFHGDRGTLAEFEHDLLTRQVEDDDICRQRRREQGLMPFPFVAMPLPLKQGGGQDGEEPGEGGGGREAPPAKKRHWLSAEK